MQTVYIDLIPQKIKPVVMASQFDNNRLVRFRLTENGEDYTLSGTETVTITIRKPDRNIVVITPEIDANNYIDVYFTEQACACFGTSFGEITIEDETAKIGTCNFDLDIELSPEFGGIDSTTEIDNLQQQIESMITADVSEVVEEIAPPIVEALVPEIIGDDYLTKAQIEESYYSKEQINSINRSIKPAIYGGTLEAGETSCTILTEHLDDNYFIDVYVDQQLIVMPTLTITSIDSTRSQVVVTFEESYQSDIEVRLMLHGPNSYTPKAIIP